MDPELDGRSAIVAGGTRTIAFLASPAASLVSGTSLAVDGALTRAVRL